MSIIFGFLKFVFLFLLIIFTIGFLALRKLQRRAREEMFNRHADEYKQQRGSGVNVETEDQSANDDDYTDYEEIK